jgi:hypothetical protein
MSKTDNTTASPEIDTETTTDLPETFTPKAEEPLFGPFPDSSLALHESGFAYLTTEHGTLALSELDLYDISFALSEQARHHREAGRDHLSGEAWALRQALLVARDGPEVLDE